MTLNAITLVAWVFLNPFTCSLSTARIWEASVIASLALIWRQTLTSEAIFKGNTNPIVLTFRSWLTVSGEACAINISKTYGTLTFVPSLPVYVETCSPIRTCDAITVVNHKLTIYTMKASRAGARVISHTRTTFARAHIFTSAVIFARI